MTRGVAPRDLDDSTRRTYGAARIVLLALLALTLGIAASEPQPFATPWLAAGSILFAGSSAAGMIALRLGRASAWTVLLWAIPFDLLALGLLSVGLHTFEDPIFPALLAIPVFYSFIVSRRYAVAVTAGAALIYAASHVLVDAPADWFALGFVGVKTAAIMLVGFVSFMWSERTRRREHQIEEGTREKERLYEQLQRRVAELQAVSQITEIIHSSLDFDRVGPLVLDILMKVLDVDDCAIFVIDQQKSETLFTASAGMSPSRLKTPIADLNALEGTGPQDKHAACVSILTHEHMMVVFCSNPGAIDSLSAEDRLVLQAVASELVVAVENSELYKLTRRLAITDELTGLHNYRYLQQRLDEEVERARRYRKDLSLLMIDADDFKRFNDAHGHLAGDVALAELARVLVATTREVDVVARYGGEEFSIVLPETDAAGAFVVAEKVREAVADHEFPDAEGVRNQHITVSIGLATYPTHAEDKDSLLRLADDALYHAKDSGKDRVRSPWTHAAVRETSSGEEI